MPGSHFKDSVLFLAWKQQAWQWCEQVIRYWKASNFESLVHITCYFHAKNRTESLQWLPTSRHIQRKYVLPSTILLWSPAASVLQQLHHKPRRNALKSKTCTICWKKNKNISVSLPHSLKNSIKNHHFSMKIHMTECHFDWSTVSAEKVEDSNEIISKTYNAM